MINFDKLHDLTHHKKNTLEIYKYLAEASQFSKGSHLSLADTFILNYSMNSYTHCCWCKMIHFKLFGLEYVQEHIFNQRGKRGEEPLTRVL